MTASIKIMCQIPEGMFEDMDIVANVQHRSRLNLIREALRGYMVNFKKTYRPFDTLLNLRDEVMETGNTTGADSTTES